MKYNMARTKKHHTTSTDRFSSKLRQALERLQQGDIAAAQAIYKRIIDKDPCHIDALYQLGTSFIHSSDFHKAIYYLSKVITLNPQSSIAHNNLGVALEQTGEYNFARDHFESAVSLDRGNADAYVNLGNAYQRAGDYTKAIDCYESALNIAPSEMAFLGLGNTFREMFEPDKAVHCYEKAIELSPGLIEAYNGIGLVLHENGELDKSARIYQETLDLPGDNTGTRWNYALLKLFCGDFKQGWKGYEYGRLLSNPIRHTLVDSNNEWSGDQSLTDRSILVYAEQGVGDEIMFASCIPELKQLTDNIHIICDKRLADIYRRSFSPTAVHELSDLQSVRQCIIDYDIDFSIPSGSLPRFFRNDISNFRQGRQYLYADQEKSGYWRQRYDDIGYKPKIGISWFGGRDRYVNARRSTNLNDWAGLLSSLDATVINLQYGPCETAITQIFNDHNISIHDWDDSDPLLDLDDFFAKVQTLDLVITIDNSTAHVAGSLGIPTVLLLPEAPDWRWQSQGNTSPWYPSLHLLRKPANTSWAAFISNSRPVVMAMLNKPDDGNTEDVPHQSVPTIGISEVPKGDEESGKINIDILYDTHAHSPVTAAPMKCAVITPVGPGHETILEQCKQSLVRALSVSSGNFSHVEHISVDDSLGRIGRSYARNIAVRAAYERGIDWIFFIDADDLMAPNAFEIASLLSNQYDAIWGKICSFEHTNNQIDERPGQLGETTHLHDIAFNDPYLTLQMGHFIRTEIAIANPFNEHMDTGEDFDYYLRVWNKYRCIRTNALLFINRRGLHSSGPKSANGGDWRIAVENVIDRFCEENEPVTSFYKYDCEIRFLIRNPFDIIQRQLICKDFFEINELEYIRHRIAENTSILEVGANIGNHIVYYSKFTTCGKVIAIEPNPEAIEILKKNLELNNIGNVDIHQLGAGANKARFRLKTRQNNLGATQLLEDADGEIEVARLDDIIHEQIDFIKIDVENMELEVLDGAMLLIDTYRPQILIEVMNSNLDEFHALISRMDYKVTKSFKYVNASNFFIEHA